MNCIKQSSQSSVFIKQAKKNSFKCCHQFVHGPLVRMAIFRIKHLAKNLPLLVSRTPVPLEVFLQFSFVNIVFIFLLHYMSRILCSITLEKRLSFCQNVWFCYCTEINIVIYNLENNVFVVDEESRGLGIVSLCVPGGGE